MSDKSKTAPDLIAYQVISSGDKRFWNRVGVAWSNSKGGCKLKLNSLPLDGEIVLMPPREGQADQFEDAGA